ncbi:hypothetical protein GGI12_003904, partial [Dipsacomyces acuminosporus]
MELQGHYESMDFTDLLHAIDASELFEDYDKATKGLFSALAEQSPVLSKFKRPQGTKFADIKGKEEQLTSYFRKLWDDMEEEVNSTAAYSSFSSPYDLVDHQHSPIGGSSLKADFVYYYKDHKRNNFATIHVVLEAKIDSYLGELPDKVLGQVADYAYHIWELQPTRTFVPVFLLHGARLSLILFSRGGCYQIDIGNICRMDYGAGDYKTDGIQIAMRRMWFLMTLGSENFGHICDVAKKTNYIEIARTENNLSIVKVAGMRDKQAINLVTHVRKPRHLLGRAVHVYKAKYKKKDVYLKLAWTPTDRLPEGAAYDVLHSAKVPNIPDVIESGIIKDDVFGYRLEYLIIEDCGIPVKQYFDKPNRIHEPGDFDRQVINVVKQVLYCLACALEAGVLHRDISAGNIGIKGNKVYLIDWGYAKLWKELPPDTITGISKNWMFDADNVCVNEATHDPFTGTPLYMGVRILRCMETRTIMDDIESLLYVIMHAICHNINGEEPEGLKFKGSENLALVRTGCFSGIQYYRTYFGIQYCSNKLKLILDAMVKFLFYEGDRFIGHELLGNSRYERNMDHEQARVFMDEETLKLLIR